MPRISSADQLDIFEEVGRGSFGVVYRGVILATGTEVAVKQIDLEHELADFFEVNREIQILSECRLPLITAYMGCFVKHQSLWVVMEYVDGGSLFDMLRPGPIADDATIVALASQLLAALAYLHSLGKIHRDLKSQNVLLTSEGRVKLTDFGVSTQLYLNFLRRNTTVGTPYWMAPEVIMNIHDGHSYKADIWLLGCCIYELRGGRPPLQDAFLPMQALRKISACKLSRDFWALAGLDRLDWSPPLLDFLRQCLTLDPALRPLAASLQKHVFFTGESARVSPEMSAKLLRKLITRKRLWDQQNPSAKTQRFYAPTEIAQNQARWLQGGTRGPAPVVFDVSTINTGKPSEPGHKHGPEKGGPAPGRDELQRVLNKVFQKLEQKTALSTVHYDQLVALNEALLAMYVPIQLADAPGSQTKTLTSQYIKYLLKEVCKPDAARAPLRKAMLPSVLGPAATTRRRAGTNAVPTAMDDIEHSLLGSWLDKLGRRAETGSSTRR